MALKLNNSGKVKIDYFTKECVELLMKHESDVFRGNYFISGALSNINGNITDDDINKLNRLVSNKYIWVSFK